MFCLQRTQLFVKTPPLTQILLLFIISCRRIIYYNANLRLFSENILRSIFWGKFYMLHWLFKLKKYRGQLVFILDIVIYICISSLLFLFSDFPFGNFYWFSRHIFCMTVLFSFFQLILRTYDSLWRYAETREYMSLLSGMVLSVIVYLSIIFFVNGTRLWIMQTLASAAVSLLAMLLVRFAYRIYRTQQIGREAQGRNYIAIIGAGSAGANLLRELQNSRNNRYIPYCFLDDDPSKLGKHISGVSIKGPINDIQKILQNTPVTDILVAIPSLSAPRRREILNLCTKTGCRIRILPDTVSFLENGGSIYANMRDVRIEDLLSRESIKLNNPELHTFLSGKTVLVTGAGGSIGSELCHQIARHEPAHLILLDIAENGVYELQQDLLHSYGRKLALSVEIASVRDAEKIDKLFKKYQPQLIFHAAAHKHVPLMEGCPEEAVKNNVFGTMNVARAAKKYHAEKFVLISTDKAVNPTNIMGASKCLCEKILQALRHNSETQFSAVRFGNVLGSNGSVIPLFKKQIAYGGPVTVTDRRIIRYFMTIPEAVQLVLLSGSMARSGEIYVLDMGEPVKIYDLAENLIRLSGFTPHKDIPIVEIGLRPGEKLYEELLTRSEDLIRTNNNKIFIERQPEILPDTLFSGLDCLAAAVESNDLEEIKTVLRALVPTWRDPQTVNREAMQAYEQDQRQLSESAEKAVSAPAT